MNSVSVCTKVGNGGCKWAGCGNFTKFGIMDCATASCQWYESMGGRCNSRCGTYATDTCENNAYCELGTIQTYQYCKSKCNAASSQSVCSVAGCWWLNGKCTDAATCYQYTNQSACQSNGCVFWNTTVVAPMCLNPCSLYTTSQSCRGSKNYCNWDTDNCICIPDCFAQTTNPSCTGICTWDSAFSICALPQSYDVTAFLCSLGLTKGEIIGIAVGAALGALALIGIAFAIYYFKNKGASTGAKDTPYANADNQGMNHVQAPGATEQHV